MSENVKYIVAVQRQTTELLHIAIELPHQNDNDERMRLMKLALETAKEMPRSETAQMECTVRALHRATEYEGAVPDAKKKVTKTVRLSEWANDTLNSRDRLAAALGLRASR